MTENDITVEAYLVIAGRRDRYWEKTIRSGRIARATVHKPSRLLRDEIAVKVRLVVPLDCFEPLNLTDAGLVEVPSSRILSPAFFVEKIVDDEPDDGDML